MQRLIRITLVATLACLPAAANAQDASAHKHHGQDSKMRMDMDGMVMNENKTELPKGCTAISKDIKITVRGGRKYTGKHNGLMYGYDATQWKVKPCSRVTVTFKNEDHVRHQWMMHGLPKYMYPRGMFHIGVTGPGEKSGTFILPGNDNTYLVHCDISEHMEKGMKAQLVAGKGKGNIPSIPGLTGLPVGDKY